MNTNSNQSACQLTDILKLDDKPVGLNPAGVIILVNPLSVDKTALALNIAKRVARGQSISGLPIWVGDDRTHAVAVFSLECPFAEIAKRIRFTITGGETKGEGKAALIVDDKSLDIMELCARARCMKMRYNIEMIIINYLQLCTWASGNKQDRRSEISKMIKKIEAMAQELNVPVIVISHRSRELDQLRDKLEFTFAEEGEDIPRGFDLIDYSKA
jgi:replicative DNA helicase